MTADDNAPAGTGASSENSPKTSGANPSKNLTVDEVLDVSQDEAFCHDPTGIAYVTVRRRGSQLTLKVQSQEFRHWVNGLCYARYGRRPQKAVLDQAIDNLDGRARFDESESVVFLRVGHIGETNYVDLGDDTGRVVEIDRDGYRIVINPPVLFRRSRGMRPLPEPTGGGAIYDLAPLLNVVADDFELIVVYEVAAIAPVGPFPVLVFNGEQGSAKTTASRLVAQIMDPRVPQLKGDPRDPRDLLISAESSWIVALDNLSSMPKGLADALCRMTSGTGALARENYSDLDEVLFTACRPVVINGIPNLVLRPDLCDRSLCLECLRIEDADRRSESEIRGVFREIHPGVLGHLFEAASAAIRRKDEVKAKLSELPRLADVTLRVEAAAPALGWNEGKATALIRANRSASQTSTVEGDAFAKALLEYAKENWAHPWMWFDGSATDLLDELRRSSAEPQNIPKAANHLSARLNELEPALRAQGVLIRRSRYGRGGDKWITVRYKAPADDADDAG